MPDVALCLDYIVHMGIIIIFLFLTTPLKAKSCYFKDKPWSVIGLDKGLFYTA
jgi:hypothetical protein